MAEIMDCHYVDYYAENRLAEPELIAELKRGISNTSFDQLPCPDIGVDGLDMNRKTRLWVMS